MAEMISLILNQLIPFAIKEYGVLKQRGEFTPEQRASMQAQILSYRDFINNPQWDPREE